MDLRAPRPGVGDAGGIQAQLPYMGKALERFQGLYRPPRCSPGSPQPDSSGRSRDSTPVLVARVRNISIRSNFCRGARRPILYR